MKTVGIIGLGTISKNYRKGLDASQVLQLIAVCDMLEDAPSRAAFSEYPFYSDYKEMLRCESLDYVVISTPPVTHRAIATYALEQGVNVIMEKPATENMAQLLELLALAKKLGRKFFLMFHWQSGSEVEVFAQRYHADRISQIQVCVQDPYSDDGITILPAKRKLLGTWLDSGSNALSLIKLWLPFRELKIDHLESQLCPQSGLPIYSLAQLQIDGIPTEICVDWRNGINCKETFLVYDGRKVHIDHSGQRIIDGETCLDCTHMDRLQQHYYGYFRDFREDIPIDDAVLIHQFLYEVAEKL